MAYLLLLIVIKWEMIRMRWCYKCNVSVNTTSSRCPLCYSQLEGNEDDAIFPYVPTVYIKHKLFIKVLRK